MALTIIEAIENCYSFEKTVAPYIPQLYELIPRLLQLGSKQVTLRQLYLDTNPFISAFAFSILCAVISFVISEKNKNYSLVDRLWSLLPSVYNAHFLIYAKLSNLNTKRLEVVFVISLVWSVSEPRYCSGSLVNAYLRCVLLSISTEKEDTKKTNSLVRDILRKKISPSLMTVFNFVFVSLTQNLLLLILTAPTYIILLTASSAQKLSTADLVFSTILLALVVIEFIADQQQWDYQYAKKKYYETVKIPPNYVQEDLDRGFLITGLWSKSRHPNFVAEQLIWIVFFLWGCWVIQTINNWSSIGFISLLILFQGSTEFTERISAGKYKEYKEYQQRVGRFLPNFSSIFTKNFSRDKEKFQ